METQGHGKGGHVTTEAGTGVMRPQAKGMLRSPAATRAARARRALRLGERALRTP